MIHDLEYDFLRTTAETPEEKQFIENFIITYDNCIKQLYELDLELNLDS